MSRRLTEMALGFNSFSAEKPYFIVAVGIFEVSLKTPDTQRRKERTFIEYCPVLGTMSRESTGTPSILFHWSYWALVSQVSSTSKIINENWGWWSHRVMCWSAFQGPSSEWRWMIALKYPWIPLKLKKWVMTTEDISCTLRHVEALKKERKTNNTSILTSYF